MNIFSFFYINAKDAILDRLLDMVIDRVRGSFAWSFRFGRILGHALGFVQVTHPFQAYRIKYVIYLMMDGQTKLWSGAHDGIRAVAAVADQDIRAAGFFKVQAFLCLTGAVAGIFTFQGSFYIHRLFALLNQSNVCIHFGRDIFHTALAAAAGTQKKPCPGLFQIFKRSGYNDAAGGLGDGSVR